MEEVVFALPRGSGSPAETEPGRPGGASTFLLSGRQRHSGEGACLWGRGREGRSWGKGPVRGDRGGGKLGTRRLGAWRDERTWSNGAGGRKSRRTTDDSGRILGEGSE